LKPPDLKSKIIDYQKLPVHHALALSDPNVLDMEEWISSSAVGMHSSVSLGLSGKQLKHTKDTLHHDTAPMEVINARTTMEDVGLVHGYHGSRRKEYGSGR
jgi:hypothetical protein